MGPKVSVTTTAGTATIHWSDVSPSVPSAACYWVSVDGDGVSWQSEELPLSRTSISFNEDGGAIGSLRSGGSYSVEVFILNSSDDYAVGGSQFTHASLQFCCLSVSSGTVQIRLDGLPGAHVVVDTSFDLAAWTPWQTNTLPAGGLLLVMPMGTNRQFFRARIPQP